MKFEIKYYSNFFRKKPANWRRSGSKRGAEHNVKYFKKRKNLIFHFFLQRKYTRHRMRPLFFVTSFKQTKKIITFQSTKNTHLYNEFLNEWNSTNFNFPRHERKESMTIFNDHRAQTIVPSKCSVYIRRLHYCIKWSRSASNCQIPTTLHGCKEREVAISTTLTKFSQGHTFRLIWHVSL